MRTRTIHVMATATVLALVACTSPDASSPDDDGDQAGAAQDAGVAVVALSDEPDFLDPTFANTFVARVVFTSFCEKLYDADDELNLVPQLAADLPQVSEDGLSVEIPLREDITFNDGTPFDAEAVKISLDRHRTAEASARATELEAVEAVEAVDPTTVRLTLSRPFSPLAAQLADRAGTIMSPTALEELGDDFGTAPVCVGPFEFESRTAGSEINFVRSEEYYDADDVKLDGVTYRFITDPNVRAANLRSGDIHAGERLAVTDAAELESDPDVAVESVTSIAYQSLSINIGEDGIAAGYPLAGSPELREALELSIDREALNDVVFSGEYVTDCLPLPMQSAFRPEDPDCTEHDPDRARSILEDSGQELPVPITLLVPARPTDQRLAEVIQSMANEVGFEVKIEPAEFVSALDSARAGDFDVFLIGWSGRTDPDGNLGDLVTTGGSNNFSGVTDPELDELVDNGAAATDEGERRDVYAQALDRLKELRPNIYLYHDQWFLGLAGNLSGVDYRSDGIPRFTSAYFTD